MLAHAPEDADGRWPCEDVRNLIEELGSEDLEQGLEVGVYNKRGAHFREKGGEQERRLMVKFQDYAEKVRSKWPRTTAVLNRIVKQYEREARWHDERDMIDEFE